MKRRLLHLPLIGAAFAGLQTAAVAEIHDYMILRLVYLNTSCGTDKLERLQAGAGTSRFKVTCRNTSTYPDGLTILCPDLDDDRACRVETKAREFDNLRLLQPETAPEKTGGSP